MKDKISLFKYLIIFSTLIIYLLVLFNSILSIGYLGSLIVFCLLSVFIFIWGIKINKKEEYNLNLNIYFSLYFILLFSLTMFIKRGGFGFIFHDSKYLNYYIKSINIIPFKTIIGCLSSFNLRMIMINIFGNLIALMPFTILLVLKEKENLKVSKVIIKTGLIVFIIELLQFILSCGRFDIDDFILNVSGSLLIYLIMKKLKLDSKLPKLFNTDFNLNNRLKNILLVIILLIIIVFDILLCIELIDSNKYKNNDNYEFIKSYKLEEITIDGISNINCNSKMK